MTHVTAPTAAHTPATLIREELDDLVSYAIHLVGDTSAATEYVVAGIAHTLRYPPPQWNQDARASLYRAVTRACRQKSSYPARPKGISRLFRRRPHPVFVDIDTQLVSKVNTVKRALMTMPFDRRASLLLRDFAGLEYREVARVLECSPANAGRSVAMARREFGTIFREIAI